MTAQPTLSRLRVPGLGVMGAPVRQQDIEFHAASGRQGCRRPARRPRPPTAAPPPPTVGPPGPRASPAERLRPATRVVLRQRVAPALPGQPAHALYQGDGRHEHDEEADQAHDPVGGERYRQQQQPEHERWPSIAGRCGAPRGHRPACATNGPTLARAGADARSGGASAARVPKVAQPYNPRELVSVL